VGSGYEDLVSSGTLIEYFVWNSAFDKRDKSRIFSPTAKRSLFLVGSFCLKRGYYIRYYDIIYTLPYFIRVLIFPPLWSMTPLICRIEINLNDLIERCKVDWLRELIYFLKKRFYDDRFFSDIICIYYVNIDHLIKV